MNFGEALVGTAPSETPVVTFVTYDDPRKRLSGLTIFYDLFKVYIRGCCGKAQYW